MFVINSDSNSKLTKIVAIVFTISAVVGLFVQVLSLLAMTKSKIGKLVRKNVINAMYDTVDESIDEASKRMPGWMQKLGSVDQ